MARAWVTTGTCWQVAGWGGLIAGTLLLVSLFSAGVTNGTNAIEHTAATGALPVDAMMQAPFVQAGIHEGTNRHLSPATVAVADVDAELAGLLADPPAANCATRPLYAGQTSWVPLYSRCTDVLP